jgi:transposase InsO family protein
MIELLIMVRSVVASLFKSRARLEMDILVLRQQINVLRRQAPKRLRLTNLDRLAFVWLYRLCPAVIDAVTLLRPETLLGWHRKGFRAYWRWKSRSNGGRPRVRRDIRDLIREMSLANPLWGAPRIHGELLKLGIDVAQTTVAKYMARHRRSPSQGWRTFLRIHADGIASIDLVIVPTITFRLLYGLVILRHGRRQLLSIGVTDHPTAEWIARQITEAFAWDNVPRYLVRDRDGAYGDIFIQRLRAMGIRDHPIAPRSPRQNGYVERLIGSIRRECLDHIVVFGEQHLRRLLKSYATYYNEVRTHLSLTKDAPIPRPSQGIGRIVSLPVLGGLHHHYVRV